METTEKIYFYPLWLRIWHGFNAIGIITLILTGISMQSSINSPILAFNLIVNLHNIAGIVVLMSYFFYFSGNLVTGNGKYYLIKLKGFSKNLIKQTVYYSWGMFHGMKSPFPLSEKRKFNPLQKFIYLIVGFI